MRDRIGIYSPARGLGSTLLAAHLFYYLREHGVRCSASSHGFRGERPLGLTRWRDIPATPAEPQMAQAAPMKPASSHITSRLVWVARAALKGTTLCSVS